VSYVLQDAEWKRKRRLKLKRWEDVTGRIKLPTQKERDLGPNLLISSIYKFFFYITW
jgi:hypothetical protein